MRFFAKLAFLSNQAALVRPALERAVAEDAGHPEVFILFGNLALAEGRLTDASVHLEKATALASNGAGPLIRSRGLRGSAIKAKRSSPKARETGKKQEWRLKVGWRWRAPTPALGSDWARLCSGWASMTLHTNSSRRRPRRILPASSSLRPSSWDGFAPAQATSKKPRSGWTMPTRSAATRCRLN